MKEHWIIVGCVLLLVWVACGKEDATQTKVQTPVDTATSQTPQGTDTNKPQDTGKKPEEDTFPKRGEYVMKDLGITLSNNFDGARLNDVKMKGDTLQLLIEAENTPINNSAYYAFKIWSNTSQKVLIELTYTTGYNHRYLPKIKIKNKAWVSVNPSLIKIDVPAKHYRSATKAIFPLDLTTDTLTVAAQPIVNSHDTKVWYANLAKGKEKWIRIKSVGKSVQGRDLPVLDIYDGNTPKGRDIVVFLTRQHPPEVTGYLAFKTFMETIIQGHDPSLDESSFLKTYRILAFPILNPDGVDLGYWRHNTHGVDLNRDWGSFNQPEVKQVADFINKEKEAASARVVLGLDFHSTRSDIFYINKNVEGMIMPNFVKDWFTRLINNIPNYRINSRSSRAGTKVAKGWFQSKHNSVGITYEMGDNTPPERIDEIARQGAIQVVQLLMIESKKAK